MGLGPKTEEFRRIDKFRLKFKWGIAEIDYWHTFISRTLGQVPQW